jgi:hypothetical protein
MPLRFNTGQLEDIKSAAPAGHGFARFTFLIALPEVRLRQRESSNLSEPKPRKFQLKRTEGSRLAEQPSGKATFYRGQGFQPK